VECWVPWDDAITVCAGKLRKLWDSLSELRSSLCEWLERTVLRPALLPVKTEVYSVFPSGLASHSKIAQFNCECIAPFRQIPQKWLSNLNWILVQTDDLSTEDRQYNKEQIILIKYSLTYSKANKLSLTYHTNMLLQTYRNGKVFMQYLITSLLALHISWTSSDPETSFYKFL
jgi:hypothetical protein